MANLDVEQLYRRYGDIVLGRCRTLLRNEADAQDACQEVWMRVLRYADAFRGESSPSTWLFRVATTTCLNRIRGRGRRREDFLEAEPVVAVEDGMLDARETRELISLLLDEADEVTASCVVHFYLDGMSHDEVGALLGLSGAAIRKRISTFKGRLEANPPRWMQELT